MFKKLHTEQDFSFIIDTINIRVLLSNHLFRRRTIKGIEEKRIRSFIFKGREQYQEFISHLVKKENLISYAHKGRIAVIFTFTRKKYGILLDVVNSENGVEVTVITVDKMAERHYVIGDFFKKEKNKIYSRYVLNESFSRAIETKINKTRDFAFYHTNFYNILFKKFDLGSQFIECNLSNSIITHYLSHKIPHGVSWIFFNIKGSPIFIRISIEKIYSNSDSHLAVIFIDIKNREENAALRAELNNEPMIDISNGRDKFSKVIATKTSITGLRIKKKG